MLASTLIERLQSFIDEFGDNYIELMYFNPNLNSWKELHILNISKFSNCICIETELVKEEE